MFDRFILMSKGEFLYQDPTSGVVKYFSDIGYQCSHEINSPEYFMRVFHIKDRNNVSNIEIQILNVCSNNYKET